MLFCTQAIAKGNEVCYSNFCLKASVFVTFVYKLCRLFVFPMNTFRYCNNRELCKKVYFFAQLSIIVPRKGSALYL